MRKQRSSRIGARARVVLRVGLMFMGLAAAAPLFAQYDIEWWTVDGGGAMDVSGGSYVLSGTAGQPDAHGAIYGGSYAVSGGFWVGVAPSALSISDVSVTEGNAGTTNAVFTVTLSSSSGSAVTVNWATSDGTATAGSDYTGTSGTLSFSSSATSQTLSVAVLGDAVVESNETFTVTLSSPTNATIDDGTGVGTILDDDSQQSLSINDVTVTEGNSGTTNAVFTVSLSSASGLSVTVSYASADGTAVSGSDYTAISGVLTFSPGTVTQTVSVPVVGDTQDEPNEWYSVGLSSAANATLSDAQGMGMILDDDGGDVAVEELIHGKSEERDLAALSGPTADADWYGLVQKPYSSYEVVVDATSGDVIPVALQRLAADGTTVLQSSAGVGVGVSRSLRWENTSGSAQSGEWIRVTSGSCTTECGSDDVYRVRAYETTYAVPRFNNAGTQITVLVLQNPTDYAIAGHVYFWNPSGSLLATRTFSLSGKQTLLLNTSTVSGASGVSGTMTVSHDGRYGDLAGKTVALESATGFSFDSPMVARAR